MAYRHHVIKGMIKLDPELATRELKQAFVNARCSVNDAALSVGCRRRTFLLWARALGLEEWMRLTREIAKRDGWFHGKVGGGGCHKVRRAEV